MRTTKKRLAKAIESARTNERLAADKWMRVFESNGGKTAVFWRAIVDLALAVEHRQRLERGGK